MEHAFLLLIGSTVAKIWQKFEVSKIPSNCWSSWRFGYSINWWNSNVLMKLHSQEHSLQKLEISTIYQNLSIYLGCIEKQKNLKQNARTVNCGIFSVTQIHFWKVLKNNKNVKALLIFSLVFIFFRFFSNINTKFRFEKKMFLLQTPSFLSY